jgi:hypothetical protein
MNHDLYLLCVPKEGWGVFDAYSCPNPEAFPNWTYEKYTIPTEQYDKVFERLIKIKEKLETQQIIPTKDKKRNIFPELSNLLKD